MTNNYELWGICSVGINTNLTLLINGYSRILLSLGIFIVTILCIKEPLFLPPSMLTTGLLAHIHIKQLHHGF